MTSARAGVHSAEAGTGAAVAGEEAVAPVLVRRRNKSKGIGTATESAVVAYLRKSGFPHAERRSLKGALDQGDVTGIPGVCIEIKGGKAAKTASDGQVALWLTETECERQNARADIGILVLQRAGIGPANAGQWWALIPWSVIYYALLGPDPATSPADLGPMRWRLEQTVYFLRHEGYGTSLDDVAVLGAGDEEGTL